MESYWCHQCGKQVQPLLPHLNCPECKGDFVEKLEDTEEDSPMNFVMYDNPSPQTPSSTTSTSNQQQQIPTTVTTNIQDPFAQTFHQFLSQMEASTNQQQQQQQQQLQQSPTTANFVFHSVNQGTNPFGGLSNMMNQLFASDFGSVTMNGFFNSLGLRSSNPGDYAIGRNFEDMLNQLFLSGGRPGNPPAAQKAIDELTLISIEQKHLDANDDCAICKDEYSLNEKVVQLPCQHFFHSECIVRWLKMHNQCPVCRFEVEPEDKDKEDQKKMPKSGFVEMSKTWLINLLCCMYIYFQIQKRYYFFFSFE